MLYLTGSGCVVLMMLLADTGCALLVTLCFIQTGTLHINVANILMHVIPLMVYWGNYLGGGLSQSDSLLTHALIGIPGIPWQITLAIIAQFVFALSNNDILLSYRISLSVLMTCKTC